ncbi:MAG: antitoxin component of RelBE/YafQ-DinJ toxin-antitoxin module [Glaciecola sp.]|jgi:antitoxin component of RelBE/YafQ-DinJ toxin-antitoxin module|uniref:hypothetical protein n=1 Tax=Congregibacter sp. TaxID=2744308 RepID=UPI0039E4C8E4
MTVSRRKARQRTKDRVLQARIPEDLDTELRGRAEQLGLSVSTVVRNVLLNTFDLVEDVVADSAHLARSLNKQAPQAREANQSADRASEAEAPAIVGWQELTLNRNGICEECNAILPRGEQASVGVPVTPRPTFLCKACLVTLSAETTDPSAATASVTEKKPSSKRKSTARSATKPSSKQVASLRVKSHK